jgi:hypothetical protein
MTPQVPLEVAINGRTHRYDPQACRCGWRPTAKAPTWVAHVAAIIEDLAPPPATWAAAALGVTRAQVDPEVAERIRSIRVRPLSAAELEESIAKAKRTRTQGPL